MPELSNSLKNIIHFTYTVISVIIFFFKFKKNVTKIKNNYNRKKQKIHS